ncbi:MAG: hypothetical protein H8E25_09745 [Planctomycetes bacterium]|nr:hypothetical protein [Planctomycetota bacterium]
MISLAISIVFAAAQSAPQLFENTDLVADENVGAISDAIEHRSVLINTELLERRSPAIVLNIAAATNFTAIYKATDVYADGYVWRGSIEGNPESTVDISVSQDVVMGTIKVSGALYQIEYAGNNVHRVKLVDLSLAKKCGVTTEHAIHSAVKKAQTNNSNNGRATTIIDVLVVYSTEALNYIGGYSAMNSKINLAMTETNSAYVSSGITQQANLVHKAEMLGYVEPASFSQILYDLTYTNDGDMDSAHTLRNQYGADCVAMVCKNVAYGGMAWIMTNVSPGFASNAFSVTSYQALTGYSTFQHELGHNMGSAHDPQNASSAAYSYSYGFRTSNSVYRTVMAYAPGARVNKFSGPSVSHNGYILGNSSQDNVRSINNTASTFSNFRGSVPPIPPVLVVPTFSAGSWAMIQVEDCSSFGQVEILFSTVGGGPTNTVYGLTDLSPPIRTMAQVTTDIVGYGAWYVRVPSGASGRTVWIQAYDHGVAALSNGTSSLIL